MFSTVTHCDCGVCDKSVIINALLVFMIWCTVHMTICERRRWPLILHVLFELGILYSIGKAAIVIVSNYALVYFLLLEFREKEPMHSSSYNNLSWALNLTV